VQGEWWPEDYRSKPLVSFDQKIAEGLGLRIGDEITVNVLGRNISATIANLREVEWRSMGINFVMVFSPNAFAGAPHTHLATVTFPNGSDEALDARILRSSAQAYPMVTSVRVKDALEAVNDVVSQLVMAIRGASSIALIASLLVLAGALAAGHRARCGGAQDARRHPGPAALGLCPRIRAARARHGRIRAARRGASRVFHRRARHESKLCLRSVGSDPGFSLGRSRERRIRAGGNLADPKSKAGAIFKKSLSAAVPGGSRRNSKSFAGSSIDSALEFFFFTKI
jgi:hypothetical protein